MIIITCVDEAMGMMFNHRRQSQDRVVRARILQTARGRSLWMSPYSAKQFSEDDATQVHVDDHFLLNAGDDDYCFIEDCDINLHLPSVKKIILYRWNRRYPADQTFPVDFSMGGWTLAHTEDFAGFSHEKITEELYTR